MNILDLIFPKRCVGCGAIGKYFCDRCATTITSIKVNEAICPVCERPAIDGVTHPRCKTRYTPDGLISFFHYDGVVKNAIKTLKYRFVFDLAKEFIDLTPNVFINNSTMQQFNNYVLIPVPLHPDRLRFRGFNQAEILGRLIAHRLNILIQPDILKRIKGVPPQADIKKRKERLENVRDIFSIHEALLTIPRTRAVLFDDVFTTGATMREATSVLKHHGVKSVWCMTMAR